MSYKIKKIFFFLFAIFSLIFLLYWLLYDLYHCFDLVEDIIFSMGLSSHFDSDRIIGYALEGAIVLVFTALIYLIFYRRECKIWPKLLILFTGSVNVVTAPEISAKLFSARLEQQGSPLPWLLLLWLYALIALAAIIWLVVAMAKYPKQSF